MFTHMMFIQQIYDIWKKRYAKNGNVACFILEYYRLSEEIV